MNWTELVPELAYANVRAGLHVIRQGETGQTDDAYRMMFGGSLFDAPPWEHPRMLHTYNGLSSTAAGAYQFISRTWDALVKEYDFPDFSPRSQDLAAIALIKGRGALEDLKAGDVNAFISKCCKEWASLPYSPYGQPRRTLAQSLDTFTDFGGRIA